MKGYLFGLGAMLVGAGLMFVLMHGEVRAEGEIEKPGPLICSDYTYIKDWGKGEDKEIELPVLHCKTKKLDCVLSVINGGVSCVKKGMFK